MIQAGIEDLGGGHGCRDRIDRVLRVIEIERRFVIGQCQIGFIEGTDGTDIFPVVFKSPAKDVAVINGIRNHVVAEIGVILCGENINKQVGVEDINAH